MSITGQRHAFLVNYRAGCTRDGALKFLDAELFSNGGFSLDLSQPVIDRALFHVDNVFNWPSIRAKIQRQYNLSSRLKATCSPLKSGSGW